MTHSRTQFQAQTIGPLCVEVAGLKNLPSLLSLSWVTIIVPTACKLVDEAVCQDANQRCSFGNDCTGTTPPGSVKAVPVSTDICRPFLHCRKPVYA